MRLTRHILGTNGKPTFGRLVSNDGQFACVTLERPIDDAKHPCIPAGAYHVVEDWHHPTEPTRYRCPELTDVPGRSQIQIHIGNVVSHSEGCILVGEAEGPEGESVMESAKAFRRLMTYITQPNSAFPFTLEVRDP